MIKEYTKAQSRGCSFEDTSAQQIIMYSYKKKCIILCTISMTNDSGYDKPEEFTTRRFVDVAML